MRQETVERIRQGDYVGAMYEAVFSGDGGDAGYWPDERVAATRRSIRECLVAIINDKEIRLDDANRKIR
jgi:hypothetical protein